MNSTRRTTNYRPLDDSYELFEAPVTVPLSQWSDYVSSGANTLYGGAIVPGGTMDDGAVYSGHVRQNPFTAGYPYPYDGEMEYFTPTPTNVSQPIQPFVADVRGTVGLSEVVNQTNLPDFPFFSYGLENVIQIVGPNADLPPTAGPGGRSTTVAKPGFIRIVFTSATEIIKDKPDKYQSIFDIPILSSKEPDAENRSTVYVGQNRSIFSFVYLWSANAVYTDESQKTIAYKINLQSKQVQTKPPYEYIDGELSITIKNFDQQDFNGILDLRLVDNFYIK